MRRHLQAQLTTTTCHEWQRGAKAAMGANALRRMHIVSCGLLSAPSFNLQPLLLGELLVLVIPPTFLN